MTAKDALFAKSKAELIELSNFYFQVSKTYAGSANISILGIAYLQYANFVKHLHDTGKAPENPALTDSDFRIMLEDLKILKQEEE